MWEVSSTAASLVGLPWTGTLPLPAGDFDFSGLPRLIGALLLLFVLPGIALNRLVLRRHAFSAAASIAITLTLSLTAAIVAGFTLDLTPGGLRPLSWTAALGAITLGSLLVAFALNALDRFREARSWKFQRFGFTGLRLLLGRTLGVPASSSGEQGPERGASRLRNQYVGVVHAARAILSTRVGAMRGRVTGGTKRTAYNGARHRLGFTGVRIEVSDRHSRRAARPTASARATGRAAGPVAPPGALPPQWPVLAVVPRRAGGGLIVQQFGFAGAQLLFIAPEPTPSARAMWHLERVAASLVRWYEDWRLGRRSTRGVDRTRGASPSTKFEHRLGFSGARLLPVRPPAIEQTPKLTEPGGGVRWQSAHPALPTLVLPYPSRRLRFSPVQLLFLAAALSLSSYAFLSAVATVQSQRGTGFTQLWITTQRHAGIDTLSIGVASQELDVTTFRLLLVSGDRTVAEWPSLQLAPGQSFLASVDVDPATFVVPSVSVVLYRLDSPSTPYRLVQASVRP